MDISKNIQGIDTVIIRVSDIVKSKQWFNDTLGFVSVFEDLKTKLVVLDTGGPTSLTLYQTDKKIEHNSETASFPIFRTTNAEATRQELKSKGVEVTELIVDEAVKFFQFFDTDKNIFEACEVL